jgi:hypothetical protein
MNNFEAMQVCSNGHLVIQYSEMEPGRNRNFCHKCGVPTTAKCAHCGSIIRGV